MRNFLRQVSGCIIAAAVGTAILGTPAMAQQCPPDCPKPNSNPRAAPPSEKPSGSPQSDVSGQSRGEPNMIVGAPVSAADVTVLRRVSIARQMISLGLEDRDPVPLIAAARIFQDIPPLKGVAAPKKVSTSEAARSEGIGSMPMSVVLGNSVDGILKRARALAAGRGDVLALIDDVQKRPAMRPRGAGGIVHFDGISKKATDVYEIVYEGGKIGAIYVEAQDPDEGSQLQIRVDDDRGNVVCASTAPSVSAMCEWTPKTEGIFRVHVQNASDFEYSYILLTN